VATIASESSPCHGYEKALDGVLNPLLADQYFQGDERRNKLHGVWVNVEANREFGQEVIEALPNTPGERIVGPAKALIEKLEAAEADEEVDEDCMSRLMRHVHGRLHPGAGIRIETSGPDYSFNREQYDELTSDLASQGVLVSVATASEIRTELQTVHEIAVYVKDLAEAGVTIATVGAALKRHLHRRRVGPLTVTIYGPDGREVLSTVELERETN
jgi:hypothetical protein